MMYNNLKDIKDNFWWLYNYNKQKVLRKITHLNVQYYSGSNLNYGNYLIKTNRIEYIAGGKIWENYRLRRTDKDLILDGDWEEAAHIVEEDLFFKSANDHFICGKPWSETDFVKKHIIDYGVKKTLIFLFDKTKLYHSMKKNSYLNNKELNSNVVYSRFRQGWSEIAIHIGREGKLYLCQGRHRLIFAKILGIEHIYVNIIVRHKEWFEKQKNKLRTNVL